MGCGASAPDATVDQRSLLAETPDGNRKYNTTKMKGVKEAPKQPPQTSKSRSAAPPPPKPKPKPAQTPPPPPKPQQAAPTHKLPSTAKPINRAKDRIDAIEKSRTITIGGIKLTYAYLSQRGFYPDDPFKANQDAYSVNEHLTKGHEDAFFAVYDGHGKDGDGCAIFSKKNLPPTVANMIGSSKPKKGSKSGALTKDQIQTAILRAHVETNKGLHKNPNIDDTLSGTTAISIYFHGRRNRVTISNVGDSRAVLGQEQASPRNSHGRKPPLKAFPLSRDQTPYRKDERARVKACGARVLSLDQLEGLEPIIEGASEAQDEDFELGEELDEGGDPPRVWAQNGDYPGTAFTRSIGDSVAEDLGVFAEPEMLTREVMPEDKIIVLASDGVFEFLTNQSVIDICAKFNDPLEACRAVVAEAYELWLQYELRTDDITIICMFLDEVTPGDRRGSFGSSMASSGRDLGKIPHTASTLSDDDVDNSLLTSEGLRPVRKHASKQTAKEIKKMKELGKTMRYDDEAFDWKEHATEKTPEEKRSIAEAIKASVLFRNTSEQQRDMIYSCMESVPVKAGEWVIRQGSVGDRFYIVDEGQFEVRIVPPGEEDESGQGGHIVHIYEGSREMHAHPSFGELALMHSMPRSASVVAKTDGHLWALHRAAFRQVLVQAQDHRKELKRVLGEIPYFQYLDSDAINKLATIMDETTFGRGENITHQGQPGECMYVIATGTCYATQMVPGETKRLTLKAGSFFGDEIFSSDKQAAYSMSVSTMTTVTCWVLDNEVMKQTMGPLLQQGK